MSNINVAKQTVNTIIIVIGIGLLLYDFITTPEVVYFKISGLIVLMYGLYKSTQQWTSDNKTEAEEDIEDADLEDDLKLNDKNTKRNGQ
jgi:hypothetical protein